MTDGASSRSVANARKKKFGVSNEVYQALYESQGGRCAICRATSKKSFNIDHDHATLKIRGLLCLQCNCLLGYAKDDINTLQSAIEYLRKSK